MDLFLLPERFNHLLDEFFRNRVPFIVITFHPRAVVGGFHGHRGQIDAFRNGDGVSIGHSDGSLEPQPRDFLLGGLQLDLQVRVPRGDFRRRPEIPQSVADPT